MHSLTQMQSSLLKKTLDMVTIKDITILILGTTNPMAKATAMAMGLAVITTMARTNAMITTMATTLGIIVVMAVTIDKVSKMSDSKKYLKGKII